MTWTNPGPNQTRVCAACNTPILSAVLRPVDTRTIDIYCPCGALWKRSVEQDEK